ncbi:MAG: type III-B CRISPR module-associated protein Cmr5 [Thiolinea sp.]
MYELLSTWLTRADQPYAGKSHLLQGITEENMHCYRLAQAEAQALMDWVKKFATAYLGESSVEERGQEEEA